MTDMRADLSSENGAFQSFLKNKIFLNASLAWGIFIGIHLERFFFGIGKAGLLSFF